MSMHADDTALIGWRKLGPLLSRLMESLPLVVFLMYLTLARPQQPQAWREPFYLCAVLALLTQGAIQAAGVTGNRIYFALACYFVSGALALAFGWRPVNEWYGAVEAAAMLSWVVAVGVVSTCVSSAGFVGLAARTRRETRIASLILLGVTILATALSFAAIGYPLWHAYVPFIAVFVAQALLRARLARHAR